MKTNLLAAVAAIALAPASVPADDTPQDASPPPVVISPDITISPEHLASIALKTPIAVAEGLRITHMGVGRFDLAEGAAPASPLDRAPRVFVPATEIPRVAGNSFGWVIRFDTNLDSLTLTEEFVLPSPITITGGSGSSIISEDGKTATTPRDFAYVWDWTYNFWGFDPQDPLGDHEFAVHFGESELARLKFKVVEP